MSTADAGPHDWGPHPREPHWRIHVEFPPRPPRACLYFQCRRCGQIGFRLFGSDVMFTWRNENGPPPCDGGPSADGSVEEIRPAANARG